jgi:hypothetical protein
VVWYYLNMFLILGMYEVATKWMIQQNKKDSSDKTRLELTNLQVFSAGSLSGMAYNSGC